MDDRQPAVDGHERRGCAARSPTRLEQLRLHLCPLRDGAFTGMKLSGAVTTTLPKDEVCRLLERLSLWSGRPVEVALPVDEVANGWFEWWTDVLQGVPAPHIEIRFVMKPARKSGSKHER